MRSGLFVLAVATLLVAPSSVRAQQAAAAPAAAPTARRQDVESIDAILAALYDVISGPAGQRRDWNRMRSLMAPSARLIPTGRAPGGEGRIRVWNVEEYIATAGPNLERDGFFEREIGRTMERYGNIVQVMSAYDSKRLPSDAQPFQRGINSIQLWFDGTRWYVVTIFWQAETPDTPIPERFLRSAASGR